MLSPLHHPCSPLLIVMCYAHSYSMTSLSFEGICRIVLLIRTQLSLHHSLHVIYHTFFFSRCGQEFKYSSLTTFSMPNSWHGVEVWSVSCLWDLLHVLFHLPNCVAKREESVCRPAVSPLVKTLICFPNLKPTLFPAFSLCFHSLHYLLDPVSKPQNHFHVGSSSF